MATPAPRLLRLPLSRPVDSQSDHVLVGITRKNAADSDPVHALNLELVATDDVNVFVLSCKQTHSLPFTLVLAAVSRRSGLVDLAGPHLTSHALGPAVSLIYGQMTSATFNLFQWLCPLITKVPPRMPCSSANFGMLRVSFL